MSAVSSAPAVLSLPGQNSIEIPIATGSDGSIALSTASLFPTYKLITLDPGYNSTGSVQSAITYIDPEGDGKFAVLKYRGIPIEILAQHSTAVESAYLLYYGKLPNCGELNAFEGRLREFGEPVEQVAQLISALPRELHPMGMLGCAVTALSSLYGSQQGDTIHEFDRHAEIIMAQMPILCAWVHAHRAGEKIQAPNLELSYSDRYLNMILPRQESGVPHPIDPITSQVMNAIVILHQDHEQNASTTTVRNIASTGANLYAAVSGGMGALWGPLHGGANEAVIQMLRQMQESGESIEQLLETAKTTKDPKDRIMGIGHRVYKAIDPRAGIMGKLCDEYFAAHGVRSDLLQLARSLEAAVIADPYFQQRKLYPNVDFYSGILMEAMGIKAEEFTTIFAFGRTAGWLAHAREHFLDSKKKIARPRQLYTGEIHADYIPVGERK